MIKNLFELVEEIAEQNRLAQESQRIIFQTNPFLALIEKETQGSADGFVFVPIVSPFKTSCQHEFKSYMGLTESYNYCVKCDQKETT